MDKKDCRDCVCLIEGEKGEWICDELDRKISKIDECPERENGRG